MSHAGRLAIAASGLVFAGVVLMPWYSRPGADVYAWNVNLLGQVISLAAFWLAAAAGLVLLGSRRLGRTPVAAHTVRAGAMAAILGIAELALHRHAGAGLYLTVAGAVIATLAGRRALRHAPQNRGRRRRRQAPAAPLTRS